MQPPIRVVKHWAWARPAQCELISHRTRTLSDPPSEGRSHHQATNQCIVDLVHTTWVDDVLKVLPQREPVCDLRSVVYLRTAFVALHRQVTRVVIDGDVVDFVDQTLPFTHVISDAYLDQARTMLNAVDEARSFFSANFVEPSGKLGVDMSNSIAKSVIIPNIDRFPALHPSLDGSQSKSAQCRMSVKTPACLAICS